MRAMKDSGIEWIGEIPESWAAVSLNKVANIQTGSTPTKTNQEQFYSDELGVPWIKAEDLAKGLSIEQTSEFLTEDGCKNARIFPPNTVYVCCIASVGKVGFSCVESSCNQQINALIFKNNYHWKYGYYVSLAQEEEYLNNASGNVMKIINSDKQSRLKCPLPPLPEQQKISAYLDRQCGLIDSVIEKTKASVEEYKKLRQAVITQAVTKGVRGDRPMKDSGIEHVDMIPIEWNEMKMKYFMYIRARLGWKGLTADEYVDEGYTFIGTPNIDECGNIDWVNVNYITKERYDESPEIMLSEGDVLLTKDGAGIGKCAYIDYLPNEATPNGSLAVITCNEMMYGKYLFYYYKSYYFQKYIDQIKAGMGVPHLFQGDLKEIAIPVPSKEEQREIISYLDSKSTEIDSLISKKEQFLTELEAYKKSLIYEYVTGKKEVPQA